MAGSGSNIIGLARALFLGFGVFLLVVSITYLILPFLSILIICGFFLGAGHAFYNYIRAFRNHVRVEKL